jgi:hypothetical protein
MSIKVIWDNTEKTIIRFIYSRGWTLSDFYTALQESRSMLDTVNYPVDFIIDVRESSMIPDGVLSHSKPITSRKHPNQGKSVIVGANALVRALFQVFRRVYVTSPETLMYSFAATLEEARASLKSESLVSVAAGSLTEISY